MQHSPGSTFLGVYKILSVEGRGANGVVYKAKHELMERVVAIKMLMDIPNADNDRQLKRFHQEARAASALNHPNIVTLYDFGILPEGQGYMIMDFVQGQSLFDVLAESGPVPYERAIRIFTQVCDAMEHAHQRGIVHRDIKPSNIMLTQTDTESDVVKIVDFGTAKLMPWADKESFQLTKTGQFFGSPMYMSPEQFLGGEIDRRADIYSVGASMYQALTGKSIFEAETLGQLISKHLSETPKSFKDARPGCYIPDALESIVSKTLKKVPGERYQSMQAVKEDLEAIGAAGETPVEVSHKIKILIADDNQTTSRAYRLALSNYPDMEVIDEAKDGEEAIDKILQLQPNVVLMDVEMDRLGGIEATKQIKSQFPNVRILMLTAHNEANNIMGALSSGADGYCLKGLPGERTATAIRAVAFGGTWLDNAISSEVLRMCAHTAGNLVQSEEKTADHGDSHKFSEPFPFLLSLVEQYKRENKHFECEAMCRALVAYAEKHKGGTHQHLATALTKLGDILFAQEKLEEAEPLYLRALEIRHQVLGPEHLEVAAALDNLGNLFDTQSGFAEAEKFYLWSLKIREKQAGSQDKLTATTCRKLAWVCRAQKKFSEAEVLEQRAKTLDAEQS